MTNQKKIIIGCDNVGLALKAPMLEVLQELELPWVDLVVGEAADGTAYPSIAQEVCRTMLASQEPVQGILLCGTGIGMAMTANKFPGIYAAVCHDIYSAQRARLSNDANLMCMGAKVIGPELAKSIARCWLTLTFQDGPSTEKVKALRRIDEERRA